MKGAPLPPITRANTALVLHDMQNDFIKESLSKPEMQAVVKRTRALIDLARSLQMPVIYTRVETEQEKRGQAALIFRRAKEGLYSCWSATPIRDRLDRRSSGKSG